MARFLAACAIVFALCVAIGLVGARAQAPAPVPTYTADGKLEFPADYRSWIYLSSGMNMLYAESPNPPANNVFDNVFVDRVAYDAFQVTGTWPDRTVLVLEFRSARQAGSINRAGHFQDRVTGIEVHVKDTTRFEGDWAFFSFDGQEPATMIDRTAACYSCHDAHAAVDTTFVQFYPTLLPIAQRFNTLSKAYLAEEAAGVTPAP